MDPSRSSVRYLSHRSPSITWSINTAQAHTSEMLQQLAPSGLVTVDISRQKDLVKDNCSFYKVLKYSLQLLTDWFGYYGRLSYSDWFPHWLIRWGTDWFWLTYSDWLRYCWRYWLIDGSTDWLSDWHRYHRNVVCCAQTSAQHKQRAACQSANMLFQWLISVDMS